MQWFPHKWFRRAVVAVTILVGVLAIADAAFAQTVDIRPTVTAGLEWIAGAAGTVLTVLAGFAIRFIAVRTGLENSKLERDMNERLDFIIHQAINFALITAQNEVNKRGAGLGAVKVDNFLIKLAADAVQQAAPGILTRFAITREGVERMVISRIPAALPMTVEVPQTTPVAGGLATPPLVKDAIREVGAPSSVRAATDPKPQPGPDQWSEAGGTVG